MAAKLKKLIMEKQWNQFDTFEMDFHNKVTIITGKNGVGKTSLLRMISRTVSPDQQSELWSGFDDMDNVQIKNVMNILKTVHPYLNLNDKIHIPDNLSKSIGELSKEQLKNSTSLTTISVIDFDDAKVKIDLPINYSSSKEWGYNFELQIKEKGNSDWEHFSPKYTSGSVNHNSYDPGISISSHKFPYIYSKIDYIENGIKEKNDYFAKYLEITNSQFNIYSWATDLRNPHSIVKQSLISMILYSSQSHYMKNTPSFKSEVENFVKLLKIVLPKELAFENLILDNETGELILETAHGDYLMDSVSGGVGAVIDLVWQMFMAVPEGKPYFVLIDEIENHLHPSLQRDILPKLCEAFPQVQFVISTHSPFVVSSVEDSYIYILDFKNTGKVKPEKIEEYAINLSTSIDDTLYNVLGISSTLPYWAEKKFSKILNKYKGKTLNDNDYIDLLKEMKDSNLESMTNELIYKMNGGDEDSD